MSVPDDFSISEHNILDLLDFIFDMKVKPYTMVIRTYPIGTFTLVLVKGSARDKASKIVGQLVVKDRLDAIWIRDSVAAADEPEDKFKEWTERHDP